MVVRLVQQSDAKSWERMRYALWPGEDEQHGKVIAGFFANTILEPETVLVAEGADGDLVGFAELSIRMDLAGMKGEPVGYVEGMYVTPEMRSLDVARNLLAAARVWARSKHCSGFASDRADRVIVDRTFTAGCDGPVR